MSREVIRPPDVPVPEGIPYSPGIKAGPFVFTAGMNGSDFVSGLALETSVNPDQPYHGPMPMKKEARYIFRKINSVLEAGGSSASNAVRINHYRATYPDGVHDTDDYNTLHERWRRVGDGYLSVNWNEWSPKDRPASTYLPVCQTLAHGAHVETMVIGIVPGPDMKKEAISTDKVPRPLGAYSQAIRAGQWVFVAGHFATDFKTPLPPEAQLPFAPYGNPMRLQADYVLKHLKIATEAAGASFDDVVSAVVYTNDIQDTPVLEEVWQKYFPKNPPARTIIPVVGHGGSKDHCIEVDVIAIIPGGKLKKEVISTGRAARPLGHQPQAIKAGPLLFISGQVAADERGLIPEARVNPELPYMKISVKRQVDYILKNTQAICQAAGTSLDNLVRAQCFYTDLRDYAPAMEVWASAIPKDPPAMLTVEVPSPLTVPGCSVLVDLIAYVPE